MCPAKWLKVGILAVMFRVKNVTLWHCVKSTSTIYSVKTYR